MSNNLNQVIRILTVITVIIAVPTLITSAYGMNVHVPFEKSPMAFAGIMTATAVIALSILAVFKRNKWL